MICSKNSCRLTFVVLLTLLLPFSVFSQSAQIKFQNLTTIDGLSQNTVQSILKDKYGFMWFGTDNGLNKYDGYEFKVYRHNLKDPNSLTTNRIRALYEDKQGNLWVGMDGGGLSLYDRAKDSFIHIDKSYALESNSSSNDVTTIYEDSRKNLWVGTSLNLTILDRKTGKVKRFSHSDDESSIAGNYVNSIYEDSKGNLWIGTLAGLDMYNYSKETFKHFRYNRKDPSSISSNNVKSIYQDKKGNLWIGTSDAGLNLFDFATGNFSHYKHKQNSADGLSNNNIYSISDGGPGKVWIGTEDGLDLLDTDSGVIKTYKNDVIDINSINNNSINTLLADETGILWIGTYAGGVNKFDKNRFEFSYIKKTLAKNSLSDDMVSSFAESADGDIWIGTDGGGLNLFKRNGQFIHIENDSKNGNSLSNDGILSLINDKNNKLWIGTYEGGLNQYDPVSGSFKHYKLGNKSGDLSSNSVFALLQDSKGNIWIGTDSGLNVLNTAENKIIRYRNIEGSSVSLSNNDVTALYEDSKGNIWVGTYVELNLFNASSGTFTHFTQNNSGLEMNPINDILEDRKGNVWIGTLGGGLNLYNKKTKRFTNFTEENGLPNSIVYGMLEDADGFIWLSTGKGLSRFDPVSKTFKNYAFSDGVQYEFSIGAKLKTRSGHLYFGGDKGFNFFNPKEIKTNKTIPKIVFTDFELFNKSLSGGNKNHQLLDNINVTREIILSYNQSVFTIKFAALNYTNSEKNQYAYKLEGFDKDWNYVGTLHTAHYTNLDPGKYTFRVKASNNDGFWNEQGASINIIVIPPFWKTWWFTSLIYLSLGAGAYAFYLWRTNTIKEQKKKLEKQVKDRTQEVIKQAENLQNLNKELHSKSEHLQVLNEELSEQKIQEQLAREQAEKAYQEADRANKEKSIFLATMSHEIRTPMNGVIGMASLLSETALTPEQSEYVTIINKSGDALLAVINDTLDFSKIESDNMKLEQLDFDLRKCIEDVMDLFSEKAAEKDLDIVYQIDHRVPIMLIGDPLRLRQILINLIGNALKFTKKGEVFVKISVSEISGDDIELSFDIRDTGIGIPNEKFASLFKAFSQVDSSTTREYGGTGLGLVISERLIKLMGGDISVSSEVGKGSTFSFKIRCKISDKTSKQYALFNTLDYEGKKVLIIDDNLTNLSVLKIQLELWKLIPVLATSGKQALDILASDQEFHLVITDMQMPEMGGIEVAQAIKSKILNIPIVLLSSIGDETKKKYPQLFNSLLTKPVKQIQLYEVIRHEFERQSDLPSEVQQRAVFSENFAQKYPLSILLAEDHLINQKVAIRILNKLGYDPDLAVDGMEVLEKLKSINYDLIFMDVLMPKIDGLEATRLIRQNNQYQPLIIAMTANVLSENREQCLNAGMDGYISKPIKLEELVDILQASRLSLLEKRSAK